MRPSKFTDVEIMQALGKVAAGTPAAQVCRALGITETTFYRWRSKYDVTRITDPREVRRLQEENRNLKQLVAELLLDKHVAGDEKEWSEVRRPIAR
ncbi:MAG: transposase [Polaromonas sp.]|nr:transposase [Gemmatimonadaceae bacterium]